MLLESPKLDNLCYFFLDQNEITERRNWCRRDNTGRNDLPGHLVEPHHMIVQPCHERSDCLHNLREEYAGPFLLGTANYSSSQYTVKVMAGAIDQAYLRITCPQAR
jgi:hypothetical protein